MTLYAHSLPDQPPEHWQPLDDHLANVAKLAAGFAAAFASAEWAEVAGWLHDLGKADSRFQGYLQRENGLDDQDYDSGRVNHSSAGAAYAVEKYGVISGRILSYLVAGHHAGLPDWYAADTGNAALAVRMAEAAENLPRSGAFAGSAIAPKLATTLRPPEFARRREHVHLWMRMLYSCLADADFLDTEAFMNSGQAAVRGEFESLEQIKPRLDAYLDCLAESAKRTPVNAIRQEILATCRRAAESAPGLFSLTVPTGGGKTLSSMAFALDHAVRHGKARVIYVIPYTSIIEQTAGILRGILGDVNVVEHHSNLDPEKETQRSRMASENWDAPIVVTTNVQFFESLYAAKNSRCRKLHNLVNSVVILDEAQLLPPELLAPCVDAMGQLVANYGVTLVLATATQPTLSTLPPPCPHLMQPTEIIPPEMRLYERLKRTEFLLPPDLNVATDWQALAGQLAQHAQVLCVVNTRRDCYDLFKVMPTGTIHLSALMCGKHRSQVIAEIKQKLRDGEPCQVISTQLVEAGVDIDFPVVYRALAGLDSIAQAAGRCNREGKLNADGHLGQVHVFVPPKPAPPGLLHKGENTTREMVSLADFTPDSPATYTRYFSLFYNRVNDHGAARFNDWLVKDVNPGIAIQFRTAAANFKLIDDQAQLSVLVRYGDSDKWIAEVRAAGPTRENMRRLQRYTVNLPRRLAAAMKADGMLEEIYDGILAQTMPNLYSELIGLDVFREALPVQDLVC